MKQLTKEFFAPDTEQVAKNLLGKVIQVGNKYGIIYETEAYKHNCDEASHAYGRKTPRNVLMYETYGFVYVYLIYGVHYCLNFTSDKQKPGAVLIRGVIPIKGIVNNEKGVVNLGKKVDGPGKLTKYFGIDKNFNGLNLENNDKIKVFDIGLVPKNIKQTPRIGISKAKDKLWRFVGEF